MWHQHINKSVYNYDSFTKDFRNMTNFITMKQKILFMEPAIKKKKDKVWKSDQKNSIPKSH